MKLTKKRKDAIKKHIDNIKEMGRLELIEFDRNLQDAKTLMDATVWKWVNKAVIAQLNYLNGIDKETGGAVLIMSELTSDEMGID